MLGLDGWSRKIRLQPGSIGGSSRKFLVSAFVIVRLAGSFQPSNATPEKCPFGSPRALLGYRWGCRTVRKPRVEWTWPPHAMRKQNTMLKSARESLLAIASLAGMTALPLGNVVAQASLPEVWESEDGNVKLEMFDPGDPMPPESSWSTFNKDTLNPDSKLRKHLPGGSFS
jgi:hypothetical protein